MQLAAEEGMCFVCHADAMLAVCRAAVHSAHNQMLWSTAFRCCHDYAAVSVHSGFQLPVWQSPLCGAMVGDLLYDAINCGTSLLKGFLLCGIRIAVTELEALATAKTSS